MTLRIKLSQLVVGLVVAALLLGAGYAVANTRTVVIHACINNKTRALTVPASGKCTRGTRALSWNQQGPRGTTGAKGAAGAKGASGSAGNSAAVSVGSVTTEPAGSQATVTNSGSGSNAVLNFGIPQGVAGANAPGTGATAYGQVWMGSGTNSAQLAPGRNTANVDGVGGGDGTAVIGVSGCSTGLSEPVITVTADDDSSDNLTGNNSAGTAAAYVTGWSSSGSVLNFGVSTYDPIHGTTANSDFSFSVFC